MATWTQKEPSKYVRSLGENEIFIKMLADSGLPLGREHWAINASCIITTRGIRGTELTKTLRKAWAHLRFEHPGIAVQASEGENEMEYTIPTPEALATWMSSTFAVDESSRDARELISSIEPSPSSILRYIPASREILLHISHWLTDGIGVIQLLDSLLKYVAKPDLEDPANLQWGEEVLRLAPCVEDALGLPLDIFPAQKATAKKLLDTFTLGEGSVGIDFEGDEKTLPRGTLVAEADFDMDSTARFSSACKAKGITVTAAVHASLAATNWTFADSERKGRHYTSTARFSLKPYIKEPFGSSAYAAGLYTTGWMEKVEATGSWSEHAQYFDGLYKEGLSNDHLRAHRAYAKGLCDFIQAAPPAAIPPSDIDISSIGVAEKHIRQYYGSGVSKVEVHGIRVGVEILTRQGTFFVWTFGGRLTFSLCYNEAYHMEEQMESFVSEVRANLLRELNLA